jgi:hypothetical protein
MISKTNTAARKINGETAMRALFALCAASALALSLLTSGPAFGQGQGQGNVGAGGSGASTGAGGRARTGGGEQNQNRQGGPASIESLLFSATAEKMTFGARSSVPPGNCDDVAEWGSMGERFSTQNMSRLVQVHDSVIGTEEPTVEYQTIFLLAAFQSELLTAEADPKKAGELLALAVGKRVSPEDVQTASAVLCAPVDDDMAVSISAATASGG